MDLSLKTYITEPQAAALLLGCLGHTGRRPR